MKAGRAVLVALAGVAALAIIATGLGVRPRPAIPGVPVVPVGWNSWNAYGCDIDQTRIEAAADAIVASGMREAGYTYVIVDDCWVASSRAADGQLQADAARFPDGIARLADYVHARGLKFGLYTAATSMTCAQRSGDWPGATGSEGHEATDAATFAAWGVDLVKDDWCAGEMAQGVQRAMFETFRDGIRVTGRPMVLMINPNSGITAGVPGAEEDWTGVATNVRITNDVGPVWATSAGPLTTQGVNNAIESAESSVAASWSSTIRQDADMLQVGASSLTVAEQRSQLAMLAVLGLPLIAGNDPADLTDGTRSLLTDQALVALAQDTGGPPTRLPDSSGAHLWTRSTATGEVLAVYNPTSRPVVVSASVLGGAAVDLWTGAQVSTASVTVVAHDTALLRADSSATSH